jgi:MFS family permease
MCQPIFLSIHVCFYSHTPKSWASFILTVTRGYYFIAQLLSSIMANQRRDFVGRKLITKLRIFALISLIMLGIGIYHIIIGDLTILLAMFSLGGGVLIGLFIGRANKVVWHEEEGKAVSKMDLFGSIILLGYIVFAIFRRKLFGHWLAGAQLSGFIICLSAGIMIGRLSTLRSMTLKVLKGKGL